MHSAGDVLLFAVAARRELTWSSFSGALEAVFVPDESVGTDVTHVRSAVGALGDSLAHWDVVPRDGTARICIAPPALAALPRPGLPAAVLCGSRSPDTLPALAAACDREGVLLRSTRQDRVHRYAPSLIEITAESHGAISGVATRLHIPYEPEPTAWTLAAVCGSLDGYLGSLDWTVGPDLNWNRRDFDPIGQRFTLRQEDPEVGLRLTAYRHPDGWAREDRLWRGNEFAVVDRNWARFAVLAERSVSVCRYDHRAGTLSVPRQLPLPKVVARSLALCSGRSPASEPGNGIGRVTYAEVPSSIADALTRKLGQHCPARKELAEDVTA